MSIGYIPQEILDEISSKCDIVSVVSEYMPLKKKGTNYQGLCPFHNEKTPSFSVSPNKQIFHCFGCGAGGNVFKFVMEMDNLNFVEAVEKLAKRANVALPKKELSEADKKRYQQNERFLRINDVTAKYYHKVLIDSQWGKTYLTYLAQRGLNRDIIDKFGLGACPPGWDGLYKFLLSKNISPEEMQALGLIIPLKEGNGYYDRFRQRLMFPIRNEKGATIAFGGRIIDASVSPQKYMNSPDTPLFNKGKHLYGLDIARSTIRGNDLAIIVEGYMDVISCHQYGINNVVAPLGTALTNDQGRSLMRNTYQIALAFDGDTAGSNATLRSLELLATLGCQVKVINLPIGSDPDDFLKKHGKIGFEQLILKSQELIVYKIDRLMENINNDSITGKMKVVEGVLPDIAKMTSPVAREGAVNLMSRKLQITENAIYSELKKFTGSQKREGVEHQETTLNQWTANSVADDYKWEGKVFRILFEHPNLLPIVENAGGRKLFGSSVGGLYDQLIAQYGKNGEVKSADFTQECTQLLANILMDDDIIQDAEKMLLEYIKYLKQEQLDDEYKQLVHQLAEAEQTGASDKVFEALQGLEMVRSRKKELDTLRKGE